MGKSVLYSMRPIPCRPRRPDGQAYAAVVESVDTGDLKSPGSNAVRVRVPSAAPCSHPNFDRVGVGFFFLIFGIFPVFPEFLEQIKKKWFFVPQKHFKQALFAERFYLAPFT